MRLIISIDILKTGGYSSILIWQFRGVVYGIIEAIVSQFLLLLLLLLVYLRNYWIGSFNKTMSRQGVVCATRRTHLDFRLLDILGGNYLLFAFETSLKVSFFQLEVGILRRNIRTYNIGDFYGVVSFFRSDMLWHRLSLCGKGSKGWELIQNFCRINSKENIRKMVFSVNQFYHTLFFNKHC